MLSRRGHGSPRIHVYFLYISRLVSVRAKTFLTSIKKRKKTKIPRLHLEKRKKVVSTFLYKYRTWYLDRHSTLRARRCSRYVVACIVARFISSEMIRNYWAKTPAINTIQSPINFRSRPPPLPPEPSYFNADAYRKSRDESLSRGTLFPIVGDRFLELSWLTWIFNSSTRFKWGEFS